MTKIMALHWCCHSSAKTLEILGCTSALLLTRHIKLEVTRITRLSEESLSLIVRSLQEEAHLEAYSLGRSPSLVLARFTSSQQLVPCACMRDVSGPVQWVRPQIFHSPQAPVPPVCQTAEGSYRYCEAFSGKTEWSSSTWVRHECDQDGSSSNFSQPETYPECGHWTAASQELDTCEPGLPWSSMLETLP